MKSIQINRLKVVLVEQGRTGKWFAMQLGKDPSTISLWCSNKIQPSLETLDKIAILLGIDRLDLINKSK
ncbi:MAG: helix-turn-helix transcriptional regulator [Bacteroidaceae bacterium]